MVVMLQAMVKPIRSVREGNPTQFSFLRENLQIPVHRRPANIRIAFLHLCINLIRRWVVHPANCLVNQRSLNGISAHSP